MTTKDQVAQLIVGEAKARNHTRDECLAEMSCLYQESQWNETIWGPEGKQITYGIAQQDGSYPDRFKGAAAQIKAFFDRLDVKRASPQHGDIWENLFWLQQGPNWPSAAYAVNNPKTRIGYMAEIKSRIDTVTPYLDKYWPASGGAPVTDNRPDFNEIQQWSPNSSGRNGTTIDAIFLHTSDGVTGDNAARDLTNFLCNPASQVSYHYAASQASDGGVTVYDVVDTDDMSWSVLSANARSINYCFAGSFAAWTRAQWMQQAKAIDVVAYLVVQDCKKYGIPTKVIAPPYTGRIPGISDHRYVTKVLGDGSHTDVGDNFPWDVFTAAVSKYAGIGLKPDQPEPAPTPQPVRVGPADDQLVMRFNCLGGQTLIEAVAEVRDHVLGTNDRNKTGVVMQ